MNRIPPIRALVAKISSIPVTSPRPTKSKILKLGMSTMNLGSVTNVLHVRKDYSVPGPFLRESISPMYLSEFITGPSDKPTIIAEIIMLVS